MGDEAGGPATSISKTAVSGSVMFAVYFSCRAARQAVCLCESVWVQAVLSDSS